VWKIADFGYTTEGGSEKMLVSEKGRMTRLYCAPELLLHGEFNTKLDIWAFGCILFEIITGIRAFPTQTSIQSYYWGSGYSSLPQIPLSRAKSLGNQYEALNLLLKATLHRDPGCRPNAAQLSSCMAGSKDIQLGAIPLFADSPVFPK
jgi:serine/threonine protein kinase